MSPVIHFLLILAGVTVDFAASDSCGVATVIAEVSSDCGVVTLDPDDEQSAMFEPAR